MTRAEPDLAAPGAHSPEPDADHSTASSGNESDARITRLRDLGRGGRIVAAICVVLLVIPIGSSLFRAVDDGWIPSNDEALIVLRARDVLDADRPYVGQPSTASHYADAHPARHPGPIEFYLLAAPVRIFGPTWGTLLTVAVITTASVLTAAWVALRRGGPAVGLGAVVLLLGTMSSTGTAVLTDPISSNVGGYPLIAGTALAWALWLDDRRLWVLAAAFWSFAMQQHLAMLGPAGVVAAWGVLGAVVCTWRKRRDIQVMVSSAGYAAAAAGLSLFLWLPPIYDQFFRTGNLGYILGFSGESDRPSLGADSGLRAVGRVVAVPPLFLRRDLQGGQLIENYRSTGTLVGALLGLALFALATGWTALVWRRARGRSWGRAELRNAGSDAFAGARLALAATAVVLAAAGIVTTLNVPDSVEQIRINFYRWAWPLALTMWGSVAWTAGAALARLVHRRATTSPATTWPGGIVIGRVGGRAVTVTGVFVAVVLLLSGVTSVAVARGDGLMDLRRDRLVFDFETQASDAVLDAIDRDRPVHIITRGSAAFLAISPAIALQLEEAGVDIRFESTNAGVVDEAQREAYGPHRFILDDDPGARIHVLTGRGSVPTVAGEIVAEGALGTRADELVVELAARITAEPLVPSARAEELLARHDGDQREFIEYALAILEDDPAAGLRSTAVIQLMRDGYFEPTFDRDLVDELYSELDSGVEVWGDDRFVVVVERLD